MYKIGTHLAGPKTLIEQLVRIGIRTLAVQAASQILDGTNPTPDLLKDFQLQLEEITATQNLTVDFTSEKFNFYDCIQRLFTDDGKGDGHIYGTRPLENKSYPERTFGKITSEQRPKWKKLKRQQTTELADRIFAYLSSVANKTPSQLHNEGSNIGDILGEMTKDNPLLHTLMPAFSRVLEISYRSKVETNALITTLAILRYKAKTHQLPENLDQLISTGYLRELPIDPYSGNALVYKRTNDDFILYSFAADLDDDGGIHSKWGEGEQGGDYVFWPVKKPENLVK